MISLYLTKKYHIFLVNVSLFPKSIAVGSPDFLSSRKGCHKLLLDEFIQLSLHMVDTVPAGTTVM